MPTNIPHLNMVFLDQAEDNNATIVIDQAHEEEYLIDRSNSSCTTHVSGNDDFRSESSSYSSSAEDVGSHCQSESDSYCNASADENVSSDYQSYYDRNDSAESSDGTDQRYDSSESIPMNILDSQHHLEQSLEIMV